MQCLEKGQGRTPVEAEERVGDLKLKVSVSGKMGGRPATATSRAPSAAQVQRCTPGADSPALYQLGNQPAVPESFAGLS